MTGSAISSSESAPVRPGSADRLLLAWLGVLLAALVGLQQVPASGPAGAPRVLALAEYLPRGVAGWRAEDLPMAGTEALAGVVQEVLNYDEAVLRAYRRDGREFTVFVAYWRAGKMPARSVAFHIPDKCWTAAGWSRTYADYEYRRAAAGAPLAPGQYREFVHAGARQHVVYWHVFGDRAIRYNPDGSPTDLSMLTDLLRRGFRQKGEQYFIRIASESPLDGLWSDAGFQDVLELVAALGPGLNPGVEQF
jgi:hypothetical protein